LSSLGILSMPMPMHASSSPPPFSLPISIKRVFVADVFL
jgi:hypothetical protein